jgi:hypothetical protein
VLRHPEVLILTAVTVELAARTDWMLGHQTAAQKASEKHENYAERIPEPLKPQPAAIFSHLH